MDYDLWNEKRKAIIEFSQISQGCIFMVDVFKNRYDYASDNFSKIFDMPILFIYSLPFDERNNYQQIFQLRND